MKKFLAKVAIFFAIVISIVLVINQIYISLDKNDSDGTKKFNNVSNNIQICNFGSSHGVYSFDYEDVDDEYVCFNFALSSQRLSYDYRIFDNYKDNIAEGAVVIIPVSYFALFGEPEEEEENFESRNVRYYSFYLQI